MKQVAVFGNAGGGKSTLSQKLSQITGLPLHVLDKIKYQAGGAEVPSQDYKRIHQEILSTERWIIDGFGCMETLWSRLEQADTLVYVDLPIYVHFWWVTKRFITGYFHPPQGWPQNSPILKSSLNSYRALWLCHRYLTPKYREYIQKAQSNKNIYHIRSIEEISQFFELIKNKTNSQNCA
ncbi:adenylate kinase [Nostoc sp. LEGE 06077]|nr:adenylate kinase [Nostoc sp. LEGE 06077]